MFTFHLMLSPLAPPSPLPRRLGVLSARPKELLGDFRDVCDAVLRRHGPQQNSFRTRQTKPPTRVDGGTWGEATRFHGIATGYVQLRLFTGVPPAEQAAEGWLTRSDVTFGNLSPDCLTYEAVATSGNASTLLRRI